MNFVAGVVLVFCTLSASVIYGSDELSVRPDLAVLQKVATKLISKRWHERYPKNVDQLKRIEIKTIRRADDLLTDIPLRLDKVKPLDKTPVYLMNATAHAIHWRRTTEHILILRLERGNYELLLHFDGGWGGRGVNFRILNIGVKNRKMAILVEDYASGNQSSQTRSHIFRWNKDKNEFVEIFNELITWLVSPIDVVYKSTLSFGNSSSTLKDIIVLTTFIRQHPKQEELKSVHESVFKWNGKRYVGEMKKPEGSPKYEWLAIRY